MKKRNGQNIRLEHFLKRRDFLKQSLAGLSAATLPALLPQNTAQATPFHQIPKNLDFIIIGSGAGGGPLACRLAEAGFKVLILEAGGREDHHTVDLPALHAKSTEVPELKWDYFVKHYADEERQKKDDKYVPGRGIWYPRAKTLGGCTAHNAMVTVYPDPSAFDHLSRLTADASWGAQNMRQYFQKLERNGYVDPSYAAEIGHGLDGWLSTEQSPWNLLSSDLHLGQLLLFSALDHLHLAQYRDQWLHLAKYGVQLETLNPNTRAASQGWEGPFLAPMATKNGRRSGPRNFILKTLQSSENLFLLTHAHVSRILFEPGREQNKAIGVEFYDTSQGTKRKREILVKKDGKGQFTGEVILAGGAFNSPQLLMLSGIGPAQHLQAKGITPRYDLPGVGTNLQDKYEVTVVSELEKEFSLIKDCTFGDAGDPCLHPAHPSHRAYGTNGVLLSIKKKSQPHLREPDLFLFALPGDFRGYEPGYSSKVDAKKLTWAVLKHKNANTAGTVRLNSKDPFDHADVNFNYFDTGSPGWEKDIDGLVQGMEMVRAMNDRGAIKSEIYPGREVQGREALSQHVQNQSWGHHASCSNPMGRRGSDRHPMDPQTVVDHEFRVFGCENLRVVDASVFPKMPGLFIALPIFMISEKAADVIIKQHRQRS